MSIFVSNMKRFQECNKIVKIFRYRHYLYIPFRWIWLTYKNPLRVYIDESDNDKLIHTDKYYEPSGKNLWRLLIGMAQSDMKWYHTQEEVFKKFEDITNGGNE